MEYTILDQLLQKHLKASEFSGQAFEMKWPDVEALWQWRDKREFTTALLHISWRRLRRVEERIKGLFFWDCPSPQTVEVSVLSSFKSLKSHPIVLFMMTVPLNHRPEYPKLPFSPSSQMRQCEMFLAVLANVPSLWFPIKSLSRCWCFSMRALKCTRWSRASC